MVVTSKIPHPAEAPACCQPPHLVSDCAFRVVIPPSPASFAAFYELVPPHSPPVPTRKAAGICSRVDGWPHDSARIIATPPSIQRSTMLHQSQDLLI